MKQIADYNKQKGNIVFLTGPVSSGKSSLCKEIITLDESWRLVSDDELYFKQTIACWKEDFPNEFAKIESAIDFYNINHAITQNQILFKIKASSEIKTQAKKAISIIQSNPNNRWKSKLQAAIMQSIIHLAKKHNVIVDAWFLSADHIHQIAEHYPVTKVAAHCSFLNVVKRTMKRNYDALNNTADLSNARHIKQACSSFMHSYVFFNGQSAPIAVEQKTAVVQALDLVNLGLKINSLVGEFSPQDFKIFRQRLLSNFDRDEVCIFLKNSSDAVVRTDLNTPLENAKALIKRVLERHF